MQLIIPQVAVFQEDPTISIEPTGSKVITDDFSFKLPSRNFRLIMVLSGILRGYEKQPWRITEADFFQTFSFETRITAI